MELVIRLYSEKPSRLGIKYTYDYQALKAYEAIVRNRPLLSFSLRAEPLGKRIDLSLVSEEDGAGFQYKSIEFNPEQLRRLQHHLQSRPLLHFVHIYPKNNTLLVAKPFNRELFVNITRLDLVGPGND